VTTGGTEVQRHPSIHNPIQPGLQREFQDNQGYTEKPCLKKPKEKKKKRRNKVGLKLREPLASASQMLELKACSTIPNLKWFCV
jgi:hypothetical protein